MDGRNKSLQKQLAPLAGVTSATIINNLAGFVINLFAARILGAERFGVFSLAFSVSTLTAAVSDLGLNLTTVRLFNKCKDEPEEQATLLGSILGFKILLFTFLAWGSIPLSSVLVRGLGVNQTEWPLFTVALVTGGLLSFWVYLQAHLQAYRSFAWLTGYILSYAGLRLLCLAAGYQLFPRHPLAWLVATHTMPALLLVIAGIAPRMRMLLPATAKHPRMNLKVLAEALNYSKWVALSSIAYASLLNVVQFILAVRASPVEVGIFSAGITFTMAFSTLNTAVRAVLFPQVTALENPQQMNGYLSKIRSLAPYYLIAVTVGIAALAAFQWYVLGAEYRAALPVFLVTALALSLTILLGLGTMLTHTLMKPQINALFDVASLCLMALLAWWLVPIFQALGAAVAYAIPLLVGAVWMLRYVKREIVAG